MSAKEDWVESLFEYGIDLKNRRVFLGEINSDSAITVAKGLYALETEDDESPIDLFINSGGGCVVSALSIYDIIGTLRCPVHTFGSGFVMSAAVLLLACGDKGNRWVSPNLQLMTHDWSGGTEGKGESIKADLKWFESMDKTWLDLMVKHSSKPASFWKRLHHRPADHYFSADEALDWGLADAVWVQK